MAPAVTVQILFLIPIPIPIPIAIEIWVLDFGYCVLCSGSGSIRPTSRARPLESTQLAYLIDFCFFT